MSAEIIILNDYRVVAVPPVDRSMPITLVWHRHKAGLWFLVPWNDRRADAAWAKIERYGDGKRSGRGIWAKPTVKAICLHPDMPRYSIPLDAERDHGEFWILASTVAQAKRRMADWLFRNRCCVTDFTIAA